MLDSKIIGFKQTVREFLKSKTNQIAIIAIVGVVVMIPNTTDRFLMSIITPVLLDSLLDEGGLQCLLLQ